MLRKDFSSQMTMRYKVEDRESENNKAIEQDGSQKTKGVTVIIQKRTLRVIAVLGLIISIGIIVLFTQTRKIDGTWIRVTSGDELAGMVVTVENSQGIIVKVPHNGEFRHAFSEGQIKWANIQKTGWGKYIFMDLVSDELTTFYDVESEMKVSLNGKHLTLRVISGELEKRTGIIQEWEKQ